MFKTKSMLKMLDEIVEEFHEFGTDRYADNTMFLNKVNRLRRAILNEDTKVPLMVTGMNNGKPKLWFLDNMENAKKELENQFQKELEKQRKELSGKDGYKIKTIVAKDKSYATINIIGGEKPKTKKWQICEIKD